MNRYERVLQILDQSIGGRNVEIGVHRAFWRGLTRGEFIAKRIRGLPIVDLALGGAGSNLVKALRGVSPFGADLPNPPPGAEFSRMPAGMPPVPDSEIGFIERWIDDGCLEDELQQSERSLVWRPTNAPMASSRTDDIWFNTPEIGWAVNSNGQILHTRDGGESWKIQLQGPSPTYLRCIAFANEHEGWCGTLTEARRMFRTRDGGTNWTEEENLPELAPSAICGMSVVSDQVVFASGTNYPNRPARMMKTLNGGGDWSAWEMHQWADLLVDCYFTSPTTGWVVGGKSHSGRPTRANVIPVVLQTKDGGATWVNRVADLDFPQGEWGWKIFFVNELVGYVSIESFQEGAILKTVDGGQTWKRRKVNDPQRNANLEGIGFIDENTGWVGGWGDADFERQGSSFTTDGGLTWSDANQIGLAINRFRFFGKPVTIGYASGRTVYKLEQGEEPPKNSQDFILAKSKRSTPSSVTRTFQGAGISIPLGEVNADEACLVTIFSRFGDVVATFEAVASHTLTAQWSAEAETVAAVAMEGGVIVRVETPREVWSYHLKIRCLTQ
jgi:photosystem II stability/assembly factor-like uncharacterized protein